MEKAVVNKRLSTARLVIFLAVASVASIVLCIGIGPVCVSSDKVAGVLLSRLPFIGGKIGAFWTDTEYDIIMLTRLPRVLLGFVVGCALAFSGASMQTLVRNELADPYILGVSYGAASFSTIGIITGLFSFMGVYQNAVNGCIGALLSIVFVYVYSLRAGRVHADTLLLGGIAIAMFEKAVVRIVALTNPQVFLHSTSAFWTQGALAGTRWAYMTWPALLIALCFAYLCANYRQLNALACGDESAATLGVNVSFAQKALLLATSVMTGITVAVSGGIGFVGLVTPHVARIFVGGDHRRLFPVSALMGGVFVLWCDVVARTAFAPQELSVGIVTALVGGPCFLWLLRRKKA